MIIVPKEMLFQTLLESYHVSKPNIYKFKQETFKAYRNNILLKLNDLLNQNDEIYIESESCDISLYSDSKELKKVKIIYEDDNILVVSKPRGIIIHEDGNTNRTLLNLMSYYLSKKGQDIKLRAIHRLDKDTTGLVLFTKNIVAHSYLDYQMQNNFITKNYLAKVDGSVLKDGIINKPIGRDRHHSNRYLVSETGKAALTKYKVIKRGAESLLDVEIKTGRTHQIRVHLKSINHPIIGDAIYNPNSNENLCLHAYKIKFKNPMDQKDKELICDGDFYSETIN